MGVSPKQRAAVEAMLKERKRRELSLELVTPGRYSVTRGGVPTGVYVQQSDEGRNSVWWVETADHPDGLLKARDLRGALQALSILADLLR